MTSLWIDWPVKSSFRRYVEALPDGAIEAAGGAVRQNETFLWPGSTHSGDSGIRVSAMGTVTLSGHGGLLMVVLDRPLVVVEGGEGLLSIEYPWAGDHEMPRTTIAHLAASGDEPDVYAVSLTEDGAELFNSYDAGAQMAPLTLRGL
ncbi:HtaA domain-containing protein [Microbacterium gorillae]|uniref:HtaA domain-containing protein n=1 Tax=Microbacterium gorillae TaxID=1231063 RepID=UPI00058DFC00|nr:HtaA domain-containing protein [Microbacterium gorillae]